MTGLRRWTGAAATALSVLVVSAASATAQRPSPLEAVDSLARVGQTERAREALQAWWPNAEGASRTDLQRGIWLRARLTVDPAQALTDYQRLVVEYPGGPFSDRALHRIAQTADAEGDLMEAAARYRALLLDYPASPARLDARTWLDAHAAEVDSARDAAAREERRTQTGEAEGIRQAADDAERARQAADDAERARQAAEEAERARQAAEDAERARQAAEEAERARQTPPAAEKTERGQEPGASPEPPASARGDYTVQLGAFSTEARARVLLARVEKAGFEARLARVPGSELIRVRAGRFEEPGPANRLYQEVRAGGFDAVLTSDAAREVPIR